LSAPYRVLRFWHVKTCPIKHISPCWNGCDVIENLYRSGSFFFHSDREERSLRPRLVVLPASSLLSSSSTPLAPLVTRGFDGAIAEVPHRNPPLPRPLEASIIGVGQWSSSSPLPPTNPNFDNGLPPAPPPPPSVTIALLSVADTHQSETDP
jgi:hypothetical protein